MRTCLKCGSDKTRISHKNGRWPRPSWYKHEDGYICENCYHKKRYQENPELDKAKWERWRARHTRIRFKDSRPYVEGIVRKGVCSWCGAVKGIDCEKTSIHHIQYHDDDILKDTVELCNACHPKARIGLKNKKK